MIEAKVEGLTELRELLLKSLPEEIQTKALQSSLAKAVQPILQQARAMAPVKSGILRRAIYSFRSRASTKVKAVRLISVRSGRRHGAKDAFYWRWVEFGRGIVTRKRGSLGNPKAGFFGREVKAVPAQPFMRPAFEARKLEAIEKFRTVMAGEIQKIGKRLHTKNLTAIRRKLTGS